MLEAWDDIADCCCGLAEDPRHREGNRGMSGDDNGSHDREPGVVAAARIYCLEQG